MNHQQYCIKKKEQIEKTKNLVFTEEQQIAYEKVKDKIENNEYKSFLLYGVTGSRKNRSIFATYRKSNKK